MNDTPHPKTTPRVPPDLYVAVRDWMLAHDSDAAEILAWSRAIAPPETPEDFAREVRWIILCAGRSAQAARTIEKKVAAAMDAGRPAVEAFGYRAKAAAIDRAWHDRVADFAALKAVLHDPAALIDWCGSLPFVGDDTKFQLAKNCGAQVCKPDIWLCRLAGFADKPRQHWRVRFASCMAFCETIRDATGDSIAEIDSILWLACNKGVLTVSSNAGPIAFTPRTIHAKAIFQVPEPMEMLL